MVNDSETRTVGGPAQRVNRFIDSIITVTGRWVCWLNVILILVILLQVVLRYGFGQGQVFLEEIQWYLYAIVVMFGISYGVVTDAHIRMDLVYGNLSPRAQEWIEVFGQLLFVLPFALILFIKGVDFVESSWRVNEGSPSPGGLPWRWAIKAALPASMLLYMLASFSRIIKGILTLAKRA
jgi:TRAP-type mannitol/chloroaromatic compound transport system permease small subunit